MQYEYQKNVTVFKVLLEMKPDINHQCKDGCTALMYACWYQKDVTIFKALLEIKPDINLQNNYYKKDSSNDCMSISERCNSF